MDASRREVVLVDLLFEELNVRRLWIVGDVDVQLLRGHVWLLNARLTMALIQGLWRRGKCLEPDVVPIVTSAIAITAAAPPRMACSFVDTEVCAAAVTTRSIPTPATATPRYKGR